MAYSCLLRVRDLEGARRLPLQGESSNCRGLTLRIRRRGGSLRLVRLQFIQPTPRVQPISLFNNLFNKTVSAESVRLWRRRFVLLRCCPLPAPYYCVVCIHGRVLRGLPVNRYMGGCWDAASPLPACGYFAKTFVAFVVVIGKTKCVCVYTASKYQPRYCCCRCICIYY